VEGGHYETSWKHDRHCRCIVTLKRVRSTVAEVEKQRVLHNLSVCVSVALVIQHAMRWSHIVICGLPRSTVVFQHFLINGTIFEKKSEHKICVLIFSTTFI
jgi:hypothetical protein